MEIRCYPYKLNDGTVEDYFATEDAIFALNATKLGILYTTVLRDELDEMGRVSILEISRRKNISD